MHPIHEALAARVGIGADYVDYKGDPARVRSGARLATLQAMGWPIDIDAARQALSAHDDVSAQRVCASTLCAREGEPLCISLNLPAQQGADTLRLTIESPTGRWEFQLAAEVLERDTQGRSRVMLRPVFPAGAYRLSIHAADARLLADSTLLVEPDTCYLPASLSQGERLAGISVQLYSVRSSHNWGMGDFGDLRRIISMAAQDGIALVSVNPLHALFPANPHHISPYSPSNRSFLNALYIDIESMPEYRASSAAQAMVATTAFRSRLEGLRALDRVDYTGVADCKYAVLEQVYRDFCSAAADPVRRSAFHRWRSEAGEALRLHALHDALHEYFFRQDTAIWGWPVWPEAFRSPDSPAVAEFGRAHAGRVDYFAFLQWVADEQLREVQAHARQQGMEVGVYLDLAVGVDGAGSEVWANPGVFCLNASAGAPPDLMARDGQDWGFPPMRPDVLHETGYALFLQNLRANMRHAGAVRFDHAVSLRQLWWIPRGAGAAAGAYVRYNFVELLAAIKIESQRAHCLVIAEDLGTVPPGLSEALMAAQCLSYRIVFFERDGDRFRAPEQYPLQALAALTTHDLPTLAAWWSLTDIDLRVDLGLYREAALIERFRGERLQDKQAMIDTLLDRRLWNGDALATNIAQMTDDLACAIHTLLASTRSALVLIQLEDLLLEPTPVNLPGTFKEYPNWQRKLSRSLEEALADPALRSTLQAVNRARGNQASASERAVV